MAVKCYRQEQLHHILVLGVIFRSQPVNVIAHRHDCKEHLQTTGNQRHDCKEQQQPDFNVNDSEWVL